MESILDTNRENRDERAEAIWDAVVEGSSLLKTLQSLFGTPKAMTKEQRNNFLTNALRR
jgi:hypothetical protein